MPIKSVIIDDEPANITNLQQLLTQYCPQVEVMAVATSAIDGIRAISEHKPNLLFLDIEMPHGNGFDLLESLSEVPFEVVFVTAFDKYAIKAIRFCALDFLLKPINILELTTAVARAEKKIFHKHENAQVQNLLQYIKQPLQPQKIALPTAEEIVFAEVNTIIRCLGENNYTYVFLSNGSRILVSKTLKEFEELLGSYGFMRVHRSYLINSRFIKAYVKKDGGHIEMTDGSQVFISRNKRDVVLDALSKI